MEYCNQGDMLDAFMKSQLPTAGTRIPFATKRTWFKQMVKSIQVVHDKSVAHMDISFENFLLHDNTVKLCDFGMSRPCTSNEIVKCMGKKNYMAPEIRDRKLQIGIDTYDARSSDVYSLGVCLLYMVTGHMPSKAAFTWLQTKGVRSLLLQYKFKLVDSAEVIIQLLGSMLCEYRRRINIDEVLAHPWVSQIKIV
jgi:serine/threonine protein kinase